MFSQILAVIAAAGSVTYNIAVGQSVLAVHTYSLRDRYENQSVNNVMVENILLTLAYMRGYVKTQKPNWNDVNKPSTYSFVLYPGQGFAFHDDTLPQYAGKIIKTTNAHFNAQEGFVSDGWLFGDGVCHFASFINVVARQAGLQVDAPVPHDFAMIPEVARKYGVSIYSSPVKSRESELQNLYVINNKQKPISFVFNYKDKELKISIDEFN